MLEHASSCDQEKPVFEAIFLSYFQMIKEPHIEVQTWYSYWTPRPLNKDTVLVASVAEWYNFRAFFF